MRIENITFDAANPVALAAFWSVVLDRPVADGANEFVAMIAPMDTDPRVLFLKVPEDKAAKNRMHLDLDCDDLAATRARLETLGASFVHEREEWGVHWITMLDPEGNEFCFATH